MDSVEMPRLGIGACPITDRRDCVNMVQTALDAGYRHVDTAQMYDNEAHVGEAIETSPVPREEVCDIPLLSEIADEYGISEAELTIAWLLLKENVFPIPRSTNPGHLCENFAAQNLAIDDADLKCIDSLHEWHQQRVNNPDNPAWGWQVSDD